MGTTTTKKYDILELQKKTKLELDGIALAIGIDISKYNTKQELIYAILDNQ
jgi:hypothetical protein